MKLSNILAGCAFAVLAFSANAHAASATSCSVPYTASNGIVNGQPAQAAQMNSNFSALQSCGNNIDNSNIGSAGLYASQVIPTSGAQATFGGSQTFTFPNALQENQGGQLFMLPYYAESTSGSVATHFDGGEMATGTFSAGFACASHTFLPPYTAPPYVTATISGASIYPALLYINSKTATAIQLCVETGGGQNSGTALIDWMSIGV